MGFYSDCRELRPLWLSQNDWWCHLETWRKTWSLTTQTGSNTNTLWHCIVGPAVLRYPSITAQYWFSRVSTSIFLTLLPNQVNFSDSRGQEGVRPFCSTTCGVRFKPQLLYILNDVGNPWELHGIISLLKKAYCNHHYFGEKFS